MSKSKARPRFTPGGVPKRRQPYRSAHEQSILRRIAWPGGFLPIIRPADQPPLFVYGDTGEAIRDENRAELDADDFKRLSQGLDPEPDDSLFGMPAQRWNARKP